MSPYLPRNAQQTIFLFAISQNITSLLCYVDCSAMVKAIYESFMPLTIPAGIHNRPFLIYIRINNVVWCVGMFIAFIIIFNRFFVYIFFLIKITKTHKYSNFVCVLLFLRLLHIYSTYQTITLQINELRKYLLNYWSFKSVSFIYNKYEKKNNLIIIFTATIIPPLVS